MYRKTGILLALLLLALMIPLHSTRPADTSTSSPPPPPRDLSVERDSIVAQEARRAGVSTSLAIAVSHVENHSGDSLAVSRAGATGIMQVLPSFWQHAFEPECGCGSLLNRRRNACVGVRVLQLHLKRFRSVDKALRAYNGPLQFRDSGDKYVSAVLERLVLLTVL